MGVAFGRVAKVESLGRATSSTRIKLDSGSRVELNPALAQRLFADYSPAHTLYFVDQGFLARVFWLGTAKELRRAVATGVVPAKTLGRFPVPSAISGVQPGWELDMEDPFRHDDVGGKLPEMRALLERHGRTDFAASLTLDVWLAHMRSRGACLAQRIHGGHIEDGVWCIAPAGHVNGHVAACPSCEMVAMAMKVIAQAAGEWGSSDRP